ncbi:MAG: DUF2160 domain-containing protein [bacterium]|nr:DUF2160 domain-containing protein [bacterium]MCP5066324.1 DUF2160 domain-containing protein [bacterium]
MSAFEWMAWTAPTAAFFLGIAGLLAGMTVWQWISPTRLRQGLLPMPTTRGDRLFIGLLASAFLHLAWLGLTPFSPLIALGLSALLLLIVMRFG